MTSEYSEGERVEVFDGDRDRWCPGTVQDVAVELNGTAFMVVKSDNEFEGDLPLSWALPLSAPELVRRP